MASPLIFTVRSRLPRLIDLLLTPLAWCGFVWLFVTGLLHILRATPYGGPRPLSSGMNTLTLCFAIALFNARVPTGWARYNPLRFRTERRRRRPGLDPDEVAESFAISESDVSVLSSNDALRVTHDHKGHIAGVEALRGRR